MLLPGDVSYLLAFPSPTDRMDTWVLIGSIVFLLACIAGLGLWHLGTFLARKLRKKRGAVKQSPEPPSATQSPKLPQRLRVPTNASPIGDDPERLQQACTALEDSLAEMYKELAESWLRMGQPQKAADALKKILQLCPGRHQAQSAQDRLLKIGEPVK
jgi:hypothetical protein